MALGGELLFYTNEDAEEFLRFLRKQGCSAVRRTINTLTIEMNIQGSIRNMLACCQALQEKEDLPPEVREQYQEAVQDLSHRKRILEAFLSKTAPGARIDEGADWDRLQSLTGGEPERSNEDLSAENQIYIRDQYLLLSLLQENSLIEGKEGGMYLSRTLDIEEAMTQYPSDLLGEPEGDLLREHHLTRLITTYSETAYQVNLGPEVILLENLDELETTLLRLDTDEESASHLLLNLVVKQMIVDRMLEIIREKKKVTREEVFTSMHSLEFPVPDTVDQFSFRLHDTFLQEVLDDLRKLGSIVGKDSKLRCSTER
jgi:hypothetical protein